ncbi:hypothetical protein HYH02_009620 [Chlamydomonas schloesseri]|uniref:Endonuclease V n=1 Tax=Chlamydomonas schloesseri TaxID=2026947 RepID=A0A835TAW9_9CHLO|nr:hypothetical protein HYH02_009620 [Chlamydomonas schloesseri]|eukprot:KAG2442132.1 hypothetical protein HYH02_009620 [Chlamydomonas schloesseri]
MHSAHTKPRASLIEGWTRQQLEMARQVVAADDVPWRLDVGTASSGSEGAPPERAGGSGQEPLLRVGGLDISFVEETGAGQQQQRQQQQEEDQGQQQQQGLAPPGPGGGAAGGASGAGAAEGQAGAGAGGGDEGDEGGGGGEGGEAAYHGPGVAALVVCSYPDLAVLYEDYEPVDLTIPYLPGFLGFREAAAYKVLLERVRARAPQLEPQVLLVDGCGVLHPRACGSACQVGVGSGYPAVGVAKNLLAVDGLDRGQVRQQLEEERQRREREEQQPQQAVTQAAADEEAQRQRPRQQSPHTANAPTGGPAESAPPKQGEQEGSAGTGATARGAAAASRGSRAAKATQAAAGAQDVQVPLRGLSGAVHGVALCPGASRRPLFVSVGHRLSLATAAALVAHCCLHRIPEPIRQADLRSRQWLRTHLPAAAAVAYSAGAAAAAATAAAAAGPFPGAAASLK